MEIECELSNAWCFQCRIAVNNRYSVITFLMLQIETIRIVSCKTQSRKFHHFIWWNILNSTWNTTAKKSLKKMFHYACHRYQFVLRNFQFPHHHFSVTALTLLIYVLCVCVYSLYRYTIHSDLRHRRYTIYLPTCKYQYGLCSSICLRCFPLVYN